MYIKWAEKKSFNYQLISETKGEEAGHRDVNHGYANILNKKEDPNEDQLQV